MIKKQKHIINVVFPLVGMVIVIGVIAAKEEFYNIAVALKASLFDICKITSNET